MSFKQSSNNTLKEFHETLLNNKINAIFRAELGSDINAACGQLRSQTIKGEKL